MTDRTRHRRVRPWLRLFCGLLPALVLVPQLAAARSHRHKTHDALPPPAATSAPVSTELEPPPAGEPGAPDYAALLREREADYRKAPSPEPIYRLGQLQSILGHVVEAQDLMRRYLADPLADPAAPHRADAERVTELLRQPSGELQVAADQEGLIAVDGHVVGALPLPLPLLLPVGAHVVSLEMRDKTMKGKLKVLDGRGAVMRFSPESGAVLVTLPPAVIVLPRYLGSLPGEVQRRLQQTAEQAIQKARLAVYSREAALVRAPELASCLAKSDCQAQLVHKTDVEYGLSLSIERRGSDASLRLSLIDGETEQIAASAERSCLGCTIDGTSAALAEIVASVLKNGTGKPRGTLRVTSQPPGATLREGARRLGKTPYEHVMLAGSYTLSLEQPEYTPERLEVAVSDGKKTTSEVTLSRPVVLLPEVKPQVVAPQRFYRPRWRLITGGILLGAGVVLGAVGVSGIAINDNCLAAPEPPATRCRERFDTLSTGAGLLGVGIGLSAAGAILIAVPRFPSEKTRAR